MYDDDDDDDDAPMTSMPRLVHRQKSIRVLFFLFFFLSLVVTIHSFDDVSQCVDMKKQDDAATITTAAATAIASQ